MEVKIKGSQKTITLDNSKFISSGGEGSIYAHQGTAFKIYTDPKAMIPHSKIKELSVIINPNVIKPEEIVFDKHDRKIGYTMRHVSNTYSLCQIFPKAFRDRTGMDIDTVAEMVQKMRDTISDIHSTKGMLIVDLNEMNFLVDKKFKNVYFIDVDSYETSSFPATAIMESIRDWHTPKFSHLTDWFSFAVVSFQMFIGIHPFKGKHPSIKGMKERMLANIPVFHKDVAFPNVCLPFDVIPQTYKNWYKSLFFEGKRLPPPSGMIEVIVVPVVAQTINGNESFDISEIMEYSSNIVKYLSIDGDRVVVTMKDLYINDKKIFQTSDKNLHISITPVTRKVISAILIKGDVLLHNSSDGTTPFHDIKADDIMSYKGRVLIRNKDTISEIEMFEMGKNIHAVPKQVANVMENATKMFDGVAIQNVIGSFMISIFPKAKSHYQIKCPEIKEYQIVDAKYDSNVLIIIGSKKGKYDKFILKFDDTFSTYSLRKVDDVLYTGINFIVLDNGTVVHINEDEEVEVFSNKKDANTIKVIGNPVISGDMKLFSDGTKVLFSKGEKMYRLKMK